MRANKRFISVALLFVVYYLLVNTQFALGATGDWKIPNNVKIVQKSQVDETKTFSTIQGAINSITDASQSNKYLIKIMPGDYNESITIKPNIFISGSSRETTAIHGDMTWNGDSELSDIAVYGTIR